MAGLIRSEDVDAVREQIRLDEVVGEYVTLKPAGAGSLKGLCPFHDERSPSFHVRPAVGFYKCFGCGAGGDVFRFLQEVDHLTFPEAVERLAQRAGVQLRYEEGSGGPRRQDVGARQRMVDAHRVAAEFFAEQLASPGARVARRFLAERGFDRAAAEQFGAGFAPEGWDALLKHLRGRGYRDDELATAGLVSRAQSGDRVYDRFRGRLVWPIRDVAGSTIGFGARRLLESDQGPKYLNTPQTPLYDKSTVLYGLDLAKREIARRRQVVFVEGYTDVMACHLSGVPTAVATCGTAFGPEHIKAVRRLLIDDDAFRGEVVFTFDGDEAGRKAALRAFEEDQRFTASTFVAVEQSGLDPCDLRLERGPEAVAALVASRVPLFEFALRSTLERFDLDSAEGRVQALRAAAPVVAGIKDPALRPEYARQLSGWLGMDVEDVRRAVAGAGRGSASGAGGRGGDRGGRSSPAGDERGRGRDERGRDERGRDERGDGGREAAPSEVRVPTPDPRDPVVRLERELLQAVLQAPAEVDGARFDALAEEAFAVPAHRAVHEVLRALGGVAAAGDGTGWTGRVRETAGESLRPYVEELAVAPMMIRPGEGVGRLATAALRELEHRVLLREAGEVTGRAQRAEAAGDVERAGELWARAAALTAELQRLRAESA
ncbi:DNA primase [uncultured Pseudokineococcus sp.]|uniref:DNA primase n=1 Tax=uncultured Pseudokineococcus sp. TaxID=1642928 RepID=UPI00261AD804|nr:DNA primase [uncultured Pseudokineococcus sp.]